MKDSLPKGQSRDQRTRLAETVFVGGAGDTGAYKDDVVRALREVGISNVRTTHVPASVAPNSFFGMLFDAVAVIIFNDAPGFYLNMDDLEARRPVEQYNLVGYSWGAVVVAQHAISEIELNGRVVDNLVLIAAPINRDLMDRLKNNPKIRKVTFINLDEHGDPIFPGMTDLQILASLPRLVYQMALEKGHFYYSLDGEEGDERRNSLAKTLKAIGLE